jgi:hypothetical protein
MSQTVEVLEYDVTSGELAYYLERRTIVAAEVLKALSWLYLGLQEQGWKNIRPPASLVDHVIDEFCLVLVRDTLIAYSVTQPWFTDTNVLSEEFIAPVGIDAATMQEAVACLTLIGSRSGCGMLSLGTRANPRQQGLARLFQQTGAKLSTIELIKDIPHEQVTQENCQGSD